MNETVFETAQEAAERLGVTVRAIQKWAANGRIQGATRHGKAWLIPKDAKLLDPSEIKIDKKSEASEENGIPDVYQISPFRMAMPLLNSAYPAGEAMKYIEAMPDPDDRTIALGEYYFFSGQPEEAAKTLEPYLDSHDPALRYSASLICTFANLSRGHIHLARFAMGNLQEQVSAGLRSNAPEQFQAIGVFTATAASVLLHLPLGQLPPLEDYLRYLPGGLKLYACYILAHKAYLEQDYVRSLVIADMGIALSPQVYPIASVYAHIVAAMALMNLKRVDEAKKHIDKAWKLAQPDDILEPFGEHHGLLQGLIEICFKDDYPEAHKKIDRITYAFSSGWRKIHNPDANHDVADNLSTTEFTVAMLYNRGWSKKEIAAHMDITFGTVDSHIKSIYNKLNINTRDELGQYMLV